MSYIRDRVIVLKKEPFREQDRRYVMYGREQGLLVAVARGSSVRTSKQAGHLEPFSESEVMIAKGAAFDKLAVARLITAPYEPQLAFYAVCGSVAHLVATFVRPGISDERIFLLLTELIQASAVMSATPSLERSRMLLSAATIRLLDLLGFAPHVSRFGENTSSVPSLALVAFMRRSSFSDVLRVTAPIDVLTAASDFVEIALQQTHLEMEPHGARTLRWLLA